MKWLGVNPYICLPPPPAVTFPVHSALRFPVNQRASFSDWGLANWANTEVRTLEESGSNLACPTTSPVCTAPHPLVHIYFRRYLNSPMSNSNRATLTFGNILSRRLHFPPCEVFLDEEIRRYLQLLTADFSTVADLTGFCFELSICLPHRWGPWNRSTVLPLLLIAIISTSLTAHRLQSAFASSCAAAGGAVYSDWTWKASRKS